MNDLYHTVARQGRPSVSSLLLAFHSLSLSFSVSTPSSLSSSFIIYYRTASFSAFLRSRHHSCQLPQQSQHPLYSSSSVRNYCVTSRIQLQPTQMSNHLPCPPPPSSFQQQDEKIIQEQKRTLRKTVRARLKALDRNTIQQQSLQVWDRLFALPQYKAAKSVGLFLSMPHGEIDTDPALLHAIQHNKTVYVPQVGSNFEQPNMELRKVVLAKDEEEEQGSKTASDSNNSENKNTAVLFHKHWPRNKWNIPEPPEDMPYVPAKPGDIDVLIVPGLAFDRNGDRLGQGKGYYDRFIAQMRHDNDSDNDNINVNVDDTNSGNNDQDEKKKPPFLVAVGLSTQVIQGWIPVAPYDQRVDVVLLPEETIVVK